MALLHSVRTAGEKLVRNLTDKDLVHLAEKNILTLLAGAYHNNLLPVSIPDAIRILEAFLKHQHLMEGVEVLEPADEQRAQTPQTFVRFVGNEGERLLIGLECWFAPHPLAKEQARLKNRRSLFVRIAERR